MKKLLIIAIAIIGIVFANVNIYSDTFRPPSAEGTLDGKIIITIWHGPHTFGPNGEDYCVGTPDVVCYKIYTTGSVTIGPNGPVGTLPVGTRIHIWYDELNTPNGILNAKLTEPLNTATGESPVYIEDNLSTRTNNEGDLETTPILE